MPKHTIDLNKPMLDVLPSGLLASPGGETLSTILASLLHKSTSGDILKHWGWIQDLSKTGKLELDDADYDYLTKFVREHSQAWVGPRGQIYHEMRTQKESAAKATSGDS